MLRRGAEAVTVEADGVVGPDVSPDGPKPRYQMGATDYRGRFSQEVCVLTLLLTLFSGGSQGYSPFGSPLNGFRSGKCRVTLPKGDRHAQRTASP
jgi:hypothetical protein